MTLEHIVVINDNKVRVPPDFEYYQETGYPGAYDYLKYKDFEITTFDIEVTTETYEGPFMIYNEDFIDFNEEKQVGIIVDSLDEARELVDELERISKMAAETLQRYDKTNKWNEIWERDVANDN